MSIVGGEDAVTRERIDELLGYLPRTEVPGRAWIEDVGGGEETGDPRMPEVWCWLCSW